MNFDVAAAWIKSMLPDVFYDTRWELLSLMKRNVKDQVDALACIYDAETGFHDLTPHLGSLDTLLEPRKLDSLSRLDALSLPTSWAASSA